MSQRMSAELTHAPSAAAARPPTEHATPPVTPNPPGSGSMSLPITVTAAAPAPPGAAAAAGDAASTLGFGAYITCPEAAPVASPPTHSSVTVANPAPMPSAGVHSAKYRRNDAAATDVGTLAQGAQGLGFTIQGPQV